MSEPIYKTRGGLAQSVGLPQCGRQDLGYSLGGAMDVCSMLSGNAVLENTADTPVLEIVFSPKVTFQRRCCFILTGAQREDAVLTSRGSHPRKLKHGAVHAAQAGCELSMGKTVYGFRTYLCCREVSSKSVERRLVGRERGSFSEVFKWPDARGRIRVIEGPEYSCLEDPSSVLNQVWTTTEEMSSMGIRLKGGVIRSKGSLTDMVSGPVNDGTVQLTPSGPIILLRHRQTVGGYPRVLNVISADVDLLAQYGPHQTIHFKRVTLKEALAIASEKQKDLDRLLRVLCSKETDVSS